MGDNPLIINPAAIFEIESKEQGVLLPRMSSQERDEISFPELPNGLLIYYTDLDGFEYYSVTKQGWISLSVPYPQLTLNENRLSLSAENSIDLSLYLDNSDSQKLTLEGNILKLESGGSVDLTSSEATGNVWSTGETTQTITVSTRQPTFEINSQESTFTEQTIDVDVDVQITNTYAYNWWWEDYQFDDLDLPETGGQDTSTKTYYPYSNNDIEIVVQETNTTTGTGSNAGTAITGGGGGTSRVDENAARQHHR